MNPVNKIRIDKNVYTIEDARISQADIDYWNNSGGGGGEGTRNYELLINKPLINGVTVQGEKNSKDLKLQDEMEALSNMDIQEILNS